MSATMTVPEQVDGLEKLITLASLRKEDIIATQTEARKQLQLTQEEQGKVAEAKAFIAKHASLASDLQRREDELLANKAAHEKSSNDFATYVAEENSRLESFAATLTAKEKKIAEDEKRNIEGAGNLGAAIAEHERQHREAMSAVTASGNANAEMSKALKTEEQRLKDWENTLKAKAQRLRDQAASF